MNALDRGTVADSILESMFARLRSATPRELPGIIDDFSDPAFVGRLADRARQLAHHDARRAAIATIYQAALFALLAQAEAETLRNLVGAPSTAHRSTTALLANSARVSIGLKTPALDWLFDLEEFSDDFFAVLRQAGRDAFIESSRGALADLLESGELDLGHITSRGVIHDFVMARENKLKDAPQNLFDAIQDELQAGAMGGETTEQLTDRVQKTFTGIARDRANVIARTETASAYATAAHDSLKAAGFTHKRWITSHDDAVRLTHNHAEQQGAIPIDEKFTNGLLHPGDPEGPPEEVINCRCYLEPADETEVTS